MPYIEMKTSKKLDQSQLEALKCGFGTSIECIPGKSEQWLMVNIEDGKNMFFRGMSDEDYAYISVSIFGKADAESYEDLTEEITDLVSSFGIAPNNIYITYHEIDKWGWNGSNF